MSIFKETFKDFVFKQLRIREAIIEQGNSTSTFNQRFGSPRININGEKVNIDKGAFYTNTVHKQCVIRMSSGVDVTSNEFLEKKEKEKMLGENLAKSYILEGGILNGGVFAKAFGKQRGEHFGKKGGAYGDETIRSNAGGGFGIVPMPGIVDADIRTKTAYGSLREAKVNFICHNKRQLEVLELLYMRPGFPLLLEWQWSPFVNNKGKINNKGDYGLKDDWFDNTKDINELNTLIIENKKNSNGNYDGFVGFCKNFEFTSRTDGGYDCTTEIIAAGEVLEGLRSRNDGFAKEEEDKRTQIDNMQFLLEGIIELSEVKSELKKGNGASGIYKLRQNKLANEFLVDSEGVDALKKYEELKKENPTNTNNNVTNVYNQASTNTNSAQLLKDYFDSVNKYFIFQGQATGTTKSWLFNLEVTKKSPRTYVRWDHLCDLINKVVFPLPNPDNPTSPLVELTYTQKDNNNIEQILKFIPYKFPGTDYSKVNNEGGRIKPMGKNYKFLESKSIEVEEILNNSFDATICLLPSQYNKSDNSSGSGDEISHIMFNVDHLLKVYNQMAYNNDEPKENFNLFDYLKKIWQDVNKACVGNHNFILQTELERPNRIRIIDFQVDPPNIEPNDLFEFKIQSNKSIVRDFNYNTTIPSSLSATIAIAAQAPTSVSDLDQVTFANFSKGIKSRFTSNVEISPKKSTSSSNSAEDKKASFLKDIERYKEDIIELALYQAKLSRGAFDIELLDMNTNKIEGKTFAEATSLASSITQQLNSLLQKDPKTGKRNPIIPSRKSAVIPLKFNCALDGISGIVIGHVFKVEKDKLPKGYQADDVAFVVMGESQKITSGQDWTTELSGQLILLDLGEDERKDQNLKYGGVGGVGGGTANVIVNDELEETTLPVIIEDEVIDNGPPVEDVVLPEIPQCPPGQEWDPELQRCVIFTKHTLVLIGNTGLTQEEIDNGGLEKTKTRLNGNTPYDYAYCIAQVTAKGGRNAAQTAFMEGDKVASQDISNRKRGLKAKYQSTFGIPFNIENFPTLSHKFTSSYPTYSGWIGLLKQFNLY